MPIILGFMIFIVFMGTQYPQKDTPKEELAIYPQMAGVENIPLRYSVKPMSESNYKNIVKQEYDYSCGSAALAILLNSYLGEKLSEQQIIQGLMQYGDSQMIEQRRAFSLLDMKRFVEVLGYKGSGYKAEIDDLKALDKPAIVPIEISGYKHFVVFRGIYGNHLFVADPYLGNSSYTINKFLEIWSQKIVFVISSDTLNMNALRLKNEDLRIITFDITKQTAQILPPETVKAQNDVIESLGRQFFKTAK